MSKLFEFREIEKQLEDLKRRQEKLQDSDELKKDLEFEERLKSLAEEYGKTPQEVIRIVAPELTADQPASRARRPRQTKIYVNPHNGEEISTKGGNHKTLKEWKQQYGAEEVESWVRT